MIQIWKLPLKSRRHDFEEDPSKVHLARQFCFDNGWIGVGWGIETLRDKLKNPARYQAALASPDGYEHDRGAWTAHRAISETMRKGDLAWCRARGDIYWLCQVTGPWIYRNTGLFQAYDLHQVRKCLWKRVGTADEVPGPVKNAFAGRGAAIAQIQAEREAALFDSARIWRKLTGIRIADTPVARRQLTLSAIGHDDLEDLVLLYLQATHHWHIVPSTAKRSTPLTECVLRNASGERAYVQIKSGHTRLELPGEVPKEVDRFFLFDLGTLRTKLKNRKFKWIDVKAVENFARKHAELLPTYLRKLDQA